MSQDKRIYLDHAATTPIRPEVWDFMLPIFTKTFGNPSSFYQEGRDARHVLDDARSRLASCINADPNEIYFTSCGTESDNWAIKGAAQANQSRGRHLITTRIEHHAVLHTCAALEKQGFAVTYLDVDSDGLVDPQAVRSAIRPDTILVSVMMANNEIGAIQPIAEIAAICREKKIIFHSDAVQAAGSIPIDVRQSGPDLLSFSGHKIYAPKGVGALYIRKGIRISNFMDGGAQERNRRAGTENVPLIAGFARAFELTKAEMAENNKRMIQLQDALIEGVLTQIPYARLNGHRTRRLPNNVNFSFEFIEGESILLMLDHYGYECSSGSACTSGSLDPSHVLLAIGLPHEIAHGSLRVTFGHANTLEDVHSLIHDLAFIVQRLRDMSPLYDARVQSRVLPDNQAAGSGK
ncbi:MAG TPA: cysteine desulfurase NifS [Clostridiales bacterium]|nr:cysteine desulfurase NifS [Clostridiales bacterium]